MYRCIASLILLGVLTVGQLQVHAQEKFEEQLSLIKAAKTAQELYVFGYKNENSTPQVAKAAYQEILDRFPDSDLAVKAIERLDKLNETGSKSAGTGNAEIQGTVNDFRGKGVEGVTVSILNTTLRATTDANGKFTIPYIPGKFTIHFSKPGYTTHTQELTIQDRTTVPLDTIWIVPIPKNRDRIYYLGENGLTELPQCTVQSDNTNCHLIDHKLS